MFDNSLKKYLPHGWVSQIAAKLSVSRVTVWRAMKDPESPNSAAIIKEVFELAKEVKEQREEIKMKLKDLHS